MTARPIVSIIGAGQVGATTAHLLALKGLADLVLIDVVEGLAKGKALDMSQSAPIERMDVRIQGTSDYGAMAGSRVVVITAGLPRKPGMSRDELLAANANIVGPIAARIAAVAPESIVIVVTNPLDVMVALALQRTAFPRARVMGMAGVLDSARLRAFVAERCQARPSDVQALVLGSHGDLMVSVKQSITVNGEPATKRVPAGELEQLIQRTRDGGAEIVSLLKQGSAFYAPASGVVEMVGAIVRDTHAVLPVCASLAGEYGLRDVCIGVPAQVGAPGIERIVETPLAPEEHRALQAASQRVREMIKQLPARAASVR